MEVPQDEKRTMDYGTQALEVVSDLYLDFSVMISI
jgi:hypothetical protein